ncbi:MAG TPA: ribose-phosphate diphosphokinase [Candidatus Saccharimonadales bacterium]|nr:ribose-phosphate diphosphokinase [Candidatus Saccharimonadales bacterium]
MIVVTKRRLAVLSGTHHVKLAKDVARRLGITVTPVELTRFANGEIRCQIEESVRGADVFVMQTHSQPVNDAVMEQAIMIDAAKRASARRITAVCPFMGYARQDRKASGREPISARLVVDIFKTAGADRIVSVDLHSGQIQGFFDGPFDHLIAMPVLVEHLRKTVGANCVIVSPDAGRVKLSERYVKRLGADMAIVHKRRHSGSNEADALHLIGDVKGRHCVVIDDMIDGAGTVCAAAEQLKGHGALSVAVLATHGLFSHPAAERLAKSSIDTLAVTDSMPIAIEIKRPKIEIVSIVDLIADAIAAIFEERSVSELFDGENQA